MLFRVQNKSNNNNFEDKINTEYNYENATKINNQHMVSKAALDAKIDNMIDSLKNRIQQQQKQNEELTSKQYYTHRSNK